MTPRDQSSIQIRGRATAEINISQEEKANIFMGTVAVYEVDTALPANEIMLLFREQIPHPESRALRFMLKGFSWSFHTPGNDNPPFAHPEKRQESDLSLAAQATRPYRGRGILHLADNALANGDFLLEVWDRGSRRDARLTAPVAKGWKSCCSNFLSSLIEKNQDTKVKESVLDAMAS